MQKSLNTNVSKHKVYSINYNHTEHFTLEQVEKSRKKFIIYAESQPWGRVCTLVAYILQGKMNISFSPHNYPGDFVTVYLLDKCIFTGKKIQDKV